MRLIPPGLEDGFSQIPNDLIFCDLSPALKVAWIQIASLCFKSGEVTLSGGVKDLAEKIGVPSRSFYTSYRRLKECGAIRCEGNTIALLVPGPESADDQPVTVEPATEQEPETIAEEIQQQAPRKPSGVSQKESGAQIAEAWNKYKPEAFMQMEKRIAPPLFVSIETHAKRLNIERSDYPEMIRHILTSCKNSDWWKTRNIKPSHIFGWGTDIEDKKFTNVERLYREGKTNQRFSLQDHDQVLSWYNEKWPEVKWQKVEVIEVKEYQDAWHHDADYEPSGTIYLYTATEEGEKPGSISHWTGRNYQPKMRYTP